MTDETGNDGGAPVARVKLPPLDIRPFQSQDVIPIRQLIADSKQSLRTANM
jgi:hypothetical protein